jgi:hypothetical protein
LISLVDAFMICLNEILSASRARGTLFLVSMVNGFILLTS